MKCSACGAILSDEILAQLKLMKEVECEFCGNLIIWEEDNKIKDQLRCSICGGPINMEDYKHSELVCQYCLREIETMEFQEADYQKMWETIQSIPQATLEEISLKLLKAMESEDFHNLSPEQQNTFQKYAKIFSENIKEVVDANKWTFARKGMKYIGQGIGILIGFASVGGIIGTTIGFLVSIIGPAIFGSSKEV